MKQRERTIEKGQNRGRGQAQATPQSWWVHTCRLTNTQEGTSPPTCVCLGMVQLLPSAEVCMHVYVPLAKNRLPLTPAPTAHMANYSRTHWMATGRWNLACIKRRAKTSHERIVGGRLAAVRRSASRLNGSGLGIRHCGILWWKH
jgi:hypothetical protein